MQRHEMKLPSGGKKPDGGVTTKQLLLVIACLVGVLVAKAYAIWIS